MSDDRIPAYVDMDRLCQELKIAPEQVDRWIGLGKLPAAKSSIDPEIRLWKWTEVDRRVNPPGPRRKHRSIERQIAKEYVYLLYSAGHIKIGITSDAPKRFVGLAGSSPFPVRLLCLMRGSYALEASLHEKFASCRTNGEWFRLTEELRDYIRRMVILNAGPSRVIPLEEAEAEFKRWLAELVP